MVTELEMTVIWSDVDALLLSSEWVFFISNPKTRMLCFYIATIETANFAILAAIFSIFVREKFIALLLMCLIELACIFSGISFVKCHSVKRPGAPHIN